MSPSIIIIHVKITSLCGKQFYKRGECPSNTFRNTFRKKSTKPLNNDIYFDEEDRAQNQSNTSMGVTIIHEHERWDNSLK